MARDIIWSVFTSCRKNDQLPMNLLKDTFLLTNTVYLRETCSIRKRQSEWRLKIDPIDSPSSKGNVAVCKRGQWPPALSPRRGADCRANQKLLPLCYSSAIQNGREGWWRKVDADHDDHHRLRGRSRPNFLAKIQQEWDSVERVRTTKKQRSYLRHWAPMRHGFTVARKRRNFQTFFLK